MIPPLAPDRFEKTATSLRVLSVSVRLPALAAPSNLPKENQTAFLMKYRDTSVSNWGGEGVGCRHAEAEWCVSFGCRWLWWLSGGSARRPGGWLEAGRHDLRDACCSSR